MRFNQLGRREFITLIGGAAARWPLGAWAQNTNKAPRRIAFFPNPVPAMLEDWRADMLVLGWTEGRDFIVMQSGIETGSRSPSDEAAQRVVANKPDLIVTQTTAHALAMQRCGDGGLGQDVATAPRSKPDIKRVGILWTYVIPAFPKEEIEPGYAELNSAARSLNLELHLVKVANSDQVQAALAEIDEGKPGSLLLTSFFTRKAMSVVTQFAVDKGLPTIVDFDWTRFAPPHPLCVADP